MSASSSFPNRLTGVTVVLPGDLLRGVTDPEVGGREMLRMKNPSAQQRGRSYSMHKRGRGATVCTREGEGLQSAQERGRGYSLYKRGRGYSLHKRGGGATVCTRGEGLQSAQQREEGLQSVQQSGEATVCTKEWRGYSLHNRVERLQST